MMSEPNTVPIPAPVYRWNLKKKYFLSRIRSNFTKISDRYGMNDNEWSGIVWNMLESVLKTLRESWEFLETPDESRKRTTSARPSWDKTVPWLRPAQIRGLRKRKVAASTRDFWRTNSSTLRRWFQYRRLDRGGLTNRKEDEVRI